MSFRSVIDPVRIQSWQSVGTTRRSDRSEQAFVETEPGRIVKRTVPVCARVGIWTVIGFPEIRSGLPGVTGKRFYEELKMQFLLHLMNYAIEY